jgi:hypothetical protein
MTFGVAVASAATASERITDLDYLKANRCKGLAASLGGDTASLDALIKTQGRGRADAVMQRADEELSKAKREAGKSDLKDRLTAELNGACVAYMGGGKEMAAGR